jgi:DNA-binding GntR family transcriptional regulator
MAEVRAQVASGGIPAGAPVPSITEQAARLRCARGTVSRAYQRLAGQGVLVRVPGLGYYAAGTPGRAHAMPSPCRYQQVAAQVRGLITTGHLAPGRAVQVQALARQHRCSRETAARALGLLASEGLLARNGTKSYHVTRRGHRARQPGRNPRCRPPGETATAGSGAP